MAVAENREAPSIYAVSLALFDTDSVCSYES